MRNVVQEALLNACSNEPWSFRVSSLRVPRKILPPVAISQGAITAGYFTLRGSVRFAEKMSGCCHQDCSLDRLRKRQRGTLLVVLGINAIMFFVIGAAALYGNTTALLADSLDNLGDALTYGLSLYAVSQGTSVKAKVALFKGGLILLGAFVVAAQIVYKFFVPSVPVFEIMGVFSLLGLVANSVCLFALWRHRKEDVNMSSVWECSRNDIASNISVFVAAGAVWFTNSGWPDVVVAIGLVWLLIRSAIRVISSAMAELRATT